MNDQLKNRINNLSPEELKLTYLKLSDYIDDGKLKESFEGPKRLVAYVKPNSNFDLEELQIKLKESLPDYMVPSKMNLVEQIPKLPNGKIDYANLQKSLDLEDSNISKVQHAKNEIESQLVSIWEEVLNFSPISTEDNFFEIGGDSILSIQIISKARKNGIVLSPNQLFEHQTISELALFAKAEVKEISVQVAHGYIELTPIQHWFFDIHRNAPHYWNQIVEIKGSKQVTYDTLKKIIEEIIGYHDALRLNFVKQNDGWGATISESIKAEYCFHFDLKSAKNVEEQNEEIRKSIISNQEKGDLAADNLFRALFFECGNLQKNKIYLIAHHLVVDMISWNIIENDFSAGIEQIEQGEQIVFDQKTHSVKAWGNKLRQLASAETLKNEIPYWGIQSEWQKLPKDFDTNYSFLVEHTFVTYSKELSENYTSMLVNESNVAFNTNVEDLLLTALVKTICDWSHSKQLHLGIERHGRSSELSALDVSNTVGWFTSYFPLNLSYISDFNLEHLVKSIKEQLRQVPNGGIGFGILKYLTKTWKKDDYSYKEPELLFNYLGKKNVKMGDDLVMFVARHYAARHPKSEYVSSLEINTIIENEKLIVKWSYSTELYKAFTIEQLAKSFNENLKNILSFCNDFKSLGYTPSDFPEAGISQYDLDNLMDNL